MHQDIPKDKEITKCKKPAKSIASLPGSLLEDRAGSDFLL